MKNPIILIILFLLIYTEASSQKLWNLAYDQSVSWLVAGDTTMAHLESMLNDETLTGLDYPNPNTYIAAARILALNRGMVDKQLILSKLSRFADFGSPNFRWLFYYQYQQIRGFLGDSGAIAGMDSVARFAPDNLSLRLTAIARLADVGIMTYYDTVRQAFLQGDASSKYLATGLLGSYGKVAQYQAEAGNFLANVVQDSTDYVVAGGAADRLAEFDKPRATQLVTGRFNAAAGKQRLMFFGILQDIDPDGQPERTIYAVSSESDEITRGAYLPLYRSIVSSLESPRYLLPFYVKFTIDQLALEASTSVRWTLKGFLNDFIPLSPPRSAPIVTMIDSLVGFKEQVANYSWVLDNNFVISLDSNLTNAHAYLMQNDSVGCARQIKLFQQRVDSAHQDSLNPHRSANLEGWKFLHYNSQYILDRLPAIPKQFTLTAVSNPPSGGGISLNPTQPQNLYDSATSVTLTATAASGHHLDHWSGNVSGANISVTTTMNSDQFDTANFAVNTFTITASAGANGAISPSGSVPVDSGTNKRFTFQPNTGYHVSAVTVDDVRTDSILGYTFRNVTTTHTILVGFAINTDTITATAGAGGTITPSGIVIVNYGSGASFSFSAGSNYDIDSVIIDGQPAPTASPYVFTAVYANHIIRIVFISKSDTVNQYLTKNWNMVSVAARVHDTSVGSIFPNQTRADYYSGSYWITQVLNNRLGYWLDYANTDSTRVNYVGPRIDSLHVYANPGWNLIGMVSRPLSHFRVVGGSNVEPYLLKYVYGGQGYVQVDSAEMLQPGLAYWLYNDGEVGETVILNGSGGVAMGIDLGNPPPVPGAPTRVALYAPPNDTTRVQTFVPTLAWYSEGVSNSYKMQVSTNLSFSPLAWHSDSIPQTYQDGQLPLTQAVQIGPMAYNTTYFWKIQGKNSSGTGPWSLVWCFKTQGQPQPPPCQCCVQSVMQLDGFTVKDHSGNGQKIYTLNGGRKSLLGASYFRMPPAPPRGLFHAEFKSGKLIQTVIPGKTKINIPISVTDAVYPLTLTWLINPDNKMQYWVTQVVNGKQQQTPLTGTSGTLTLDAQSVKNGNLIITTQASQPPPCY